MPSSSVPPTLLKEPAAASAPRPAAPDPYAARVSRIRAAILERFPRDKTPKISLLEKAFSDAEHHHQGQQRKSGEPYILHPLRVALACSEAGLDLETVIIALLHDVIEDTEMTKAEVQAQYGGWLADVVDGLTKPAQEERQLGSAPVATYRKLIHSTLKDLRTVQVKLFDRLDNMRDLGFLDRARQRRIGLETLTVYVPMAQRLGMQDLSDELTALCFRYLYPRRFAATLKGLKQRITEEQPRVQALKRLLESILEEDQLAGVAVKPLNISISDLIHAGRLPPRVLTGFEVIVPTDKDCYRALGALHMKCRVVPNRIKDHISNPRPNRYQALHSQVFLGGEPITLIVCSQAMEAINRAGILVNWDGSLEDLGRYYESYLDLLDHVSDSSDLRMNDVLRHAQLETLQMFTPKGKLLSLPPGASVIDFAFAIHTDLGIHCAGAHMGGEWVSPFRELRDGEMVEIVTDPQVLPTPQWLDHVRTTRAQVAIRRVLKTQANQRAQELGRSLLVQELERIGEPAEELLATAGFAQALQHSGLAPGQFFQLLATRRLALKEFLEEHQLVSRKSLDKLEGQEPGLLQRYLKPMFSSAPSPVLLVPEEGDAFITLSGCCMPLPGDPIVGVQTEQGVAIHRAGCDTLAAADGQSLISVAWDTGTALLPYTLEIRLVDQVGMIYRISKVMNDLHVNIRDLMMDRQAPAGQAVLKLALEPISPKTYHKIVARLRGIKEITAISHVAAATTLEREGQRPGGDTGPLRGWDPP